MVNGKLTEAEKAVDTKAEAKMQLIVKALIAGAHSLHMRPVIVNKALGSKISRLPLLSYVNGKEGRYFVLAELSRHYKVNMRVVLDAIRFIHENLLAYIDVKGIKLRDTEAMVDLLEMALIRRGDGGFSTAAMDDSTIKLYVRDLKCPKSSTKGSGGKPVITPAWLLGGEAADELEQLLDDDTLETIAEDIDSLSIDNYTEEELEKIKIDDPELFQKILDINDDS